MPSKLHSFMWFFIKKHLLGFTGFIFVSIYWAANLSLSPYAMKLILDAIASSQEDPSSLFEKVLPPACLYIASGFFLGMVLRFYDWLELQVYPKLRIEITEEMFTYVEKHSYSYFQENFSGSLGNKINDMAKSACLILSNLIDDFFARMLSLVFGAATMFFVHPYFACLLMTWTLLFFTVSLFLSKRAQKYSENFSESRSGVMGRVIDSLSNILTVKLFARESFEKTYLKKSLEESLMKDKKSLWYLLKVKAFYAFSISFLTAAMTGLLIYQFSLGLVSVGDFALILTLNMFLIEELFFLANQLVPFSEEVGTAKQALSIISHPHDMVETSFTPLKVSKGQITFEKVEFEYKKGKTLFSNKSITIHPGEKVGLVGFSGGGKSTFVHLILRFFDVQSGRILIDGQDIKNVSLDSLRESITMIPQEPILFHRSLIENIRYGNIHATDKEVIECAKKAHCHEFITHMSEGYHSLVGERGVKLSGGQRQRLAIARAMLKNAPILILDEATASLDSVTENHIQESLSLLMKGKTTLVIAHRLSTLFNMDRILVFNEGKIIEDGSHSELLALGGHYAKLWSMQACGFIPDNPKTSFKTLLAG